MEVQQICERWSREGKAKVFEVGVELCGRARYSGKKTPGRLVSIPLLKISPMHCSQAVHVIHGQDCIVLPGHRVGPTY